MLFSSCKGETHTAKQGFKQLFRRLRSMYKPEKLDSKDDFTLENLKQAAIVVFGCPKERFTTAEFEVLKRYVKSGGSVLVMLTEGGEAKAGTNINYWLEEYGMAVNNDAVVRTTHYKYLHPKEVLISDGILNRGVLAAVGKSPGQEADEDFRAVKARAAFDGTGLDFVYPYGSTLSVQKPAVPVVSSGKIAYPMNRPLGKHASKHACWKGPGHMTMAVQAKACKSTRQVTLDGQRAIACYTPFGTVHMQCTDHIHCKMKYLVRVLLRSISITASGRSPAGHDALPEYTLIAHTLTYTQVLCGPSKVRAALLSLALWPCLMTSGSTRRRTPSSWTSCSSG